MNLKKKTDIIFKNRIINAKNLSEIKRGIKEGKIVRCNFCSVEKEGISCAEEIEKEVGADIRGTRLDEKETPSGKCAICGKPSTKIVYIAKSY